MSGRDRGVWAMWRFIPRLLPYLRPYRWLASASIFLTGFAVLIGLAEPWPLAFMVDTVLGNHPAPAAVKQVIGTSDRFVLLVLAAVAGLAVVAIRNGLQVLHEYVNTKLHQRVVLDFRSDLFNHAQRLSVSYHDATPTGQLMSQMNFMPDDAGSLLVGLPPLAQSVLSLVGMMVIAIKLDPFLALLALTVVPGIYYSVGLYSSRIVPRLRKVRGLEWQTLSIIFEAMGMMRVVAAFARERYEFRRFRLQGETAADARVKLTVRQTLFSLAVNTLTAGGTALVLGVGAVHVLRNHLTVGELLVFLSYIAAVYGPLETISETIGGMQQQLVNVQGAFLLLDTLPEIKEAKDAIELLPMKGAVAFEHVYFNYKGRKAALIDITFTARPGERIAIVGPTGAGKTTLVGLIKRFHDAKSGVVRIDGIEITKLKLKSIREQISVVLQVPELFSGTIADNIRYGFLDAMGSQIIDAAKAANAHDFIERLPDGYLTELGEGGAQLSVGERQRICVARAFLKDAPILILDEPTSSIDSMTEAVILEALDRLSVGRTTFVIAHRLSTIRYADQILVMDQGRLVERGTHEELVLKDGLYRQMYDAQVGVQRRETITRPVISLGAAESAAGSRQETGALIAEVRNALARNLGGASDRPELTQAATLLVHAAQPIIDKGPPESTRILAALKSDPLGESSVAAACASALLDIQRLADALSSAAAEKAIA